MNNIRPFLKRVLAYTIDLCLVLVVSSIISGLPIFNKNMEKYQNTYKEYEEEYYLYSDYLTLLEESYKDKEISEEEYTKLTEDKKIEDFISSKYEDNKITEKEYKKIVSNINEDFDKVAKNYIYILEKQGSTNTIITLVCTLIYFGIIQYFLKGKTIGKKLLKLQVVSSTHKKVNIFQYILRSLLVNDVLLNGVGVIFVIFTSKSVFIKADNIINILISLVEAAIIFLVLTREDQRGLHDLLFGTKVISTKIDEKTTKIEDKKIIEAQIEEPKKEEKTKTKKKNNKNSDK